MKKINKSRELDREYLCCLYRVDLDEILNLSEARNFNCKISDEDYEYESLDELQTKCGNRIFYLKINVYPANTSDKYCNWLNSIEIRIKKSGITISSPKEDKFMLLWQEINDLVASKEPWYKKIIAPLGWGWATIIWISIIPKDHEKLSELTHLQGSVLFGVLGLLFCMSTFSWIYKRKNSGVYLQNKHEISGIWERYGEKLMFLIFGSILTVAVKFVTDLFSRN